MRSRSVQELAGIVALITVAGIAGFWAHRHDEATSETATTSASVTAAEVTANGNTFTRERAASLIADVTCAQEQLCAQQAGVARANESLCSDERRTQIAAATSVHACTGFVGAAALSACLRAIEGSRCEGVSPDGPVACRAAEICRP